LGHGALHAVTIRLWSTKSSCSRPRRSPFLLNWQGTTWGSPDVPGARRTNGSRPEEAKLSMKANGPANVKTGKMRKASTRGRQTSRTHLNASADTILVDVIRLSYGPGSTNTEGLAKQFLHTATGPVRQRAKSLCCRWLFCRRGLSFHFNLLPQLGQKRLDVHPFRL